MSVKTATGRFPWHKAWHDEEMADPRFRACDFFERGVYKTLQDLCGQTNNEGTLRTNRDGPPLTYKELVAWLVSAAPGCSRPLAKRALDRLLSPSIGLLSRRRNDVIIVTEWVRQQTQPGSPEAERVRRFRARQALALSALPPPSPPHASASGGAGAPRQDRYMKRTGSVTCNADHESSEAEIVRHEEDTRVSHEDHDAESRSGSARFAQSGGEGGGKDRIWTQDPVQAACWLTSEYGAFAQNVYRKALRELEGKFGPDDGRKAFRECLVELWHAIQDNRVRTTRSALFRHIWRRRVEGGGP